MGKHALMLTAALLLPTALPVWAQTPAPRTGAAQVTAGDSANHVVGYTAWDDDFFYVSVQVNKPTISGKNGTAFSNPLEDDAVIVALQTNGDHTGTKPDAHTAFLVASAAGGAQLYSGANKLPLFNGVADIQKRLADLGMDKSLTPPQQEAARAALFGRVIKFVVAPKGAPRGSGGAMSGYTVEAAIPWTDLGGKPNAETRMGFNVVAQSIVPGSPAIQSLSARVKTSADADNPSLWDDIQLHNSALPSRPNLLFSPRLAASKPVIDGELLTGEWNNIAGFGFGGGRESGGEFSLQRTLDARVRPAFAAKPPRFVPAGMDTPAPPLPSDIPEHKPQLLAHLVMARYAYRYQGDPRKAAPLVGVTRANGSTALAHHPLEGVGPWLSYDRADWHRSQLREARRSGIDVILPEYRGDSASRKQYADKGLRVLASALQSLAQTGQDYPQVGLYLDTSSLGDALGAQPDMKQAGAQVALYGMVRDFYRQIPAQFRAQVTLQAQSGGRVAYPVFLSSASAWKDMDSAFVQTLRAKFAQEFDGADLLVLGGSDFKGKASLDGYFTDTRDKGFQFENGGWIKTGSVGAGYDGIQGENAPGENAPDAPYLPRRNGDTYRQNWKAALKQNPDWILLDGWNDYDVGAEIAPTLEAGYSTADITRENVRQYLGLTKRNVKFLAHNAPRTMQAGRTYSVNARAQNTGMEPWGSALNVPGNPAVQFTYRWLRNGTALGGGAGATLASLTLPTQNVNGDLSVAAAVNGNPLAPGDYTLEIRLADEGKKGAPSVPIGTEPGTALQIPVTIVSGEGDKRLPAFAATVIHSDVPAFMEAGSVYAATATLRNDGAATWSKAAGARVTFRLSGIGFSAKSPGSQLETPVSSADATMELPNDVLPGQTVNVRVMLPTLDADGKPLPVWTPDENWTYAGRWEVAQGTTEASSVGTRTLPMPISIVDLDFGAKFVSDATTPILPAERRQPVRLVVQNNGPQIWKKEQVRIGYHWYYQDGSEYIWEDETTPIPQDVAPGQTTGDLLAWITPPPNDGTYTLVWDVKVGDTWASTLAATHPGDEVAHTIQVRGGRLNFVDLSKAFNLDGVMDDDRAGTGDFDGQGNAFPASLLPPYATGPVVSSGIWLFSEKTGPDSSRRISFKWGDKDGSSKNFIACKGQRVELGKNNGTVRVLHVLAASTGKDVIASLKLIFQEPTSQSEDLYTMATGPWNQPPHHGEEIAFLSRRIATSKGIQNSAVALFHYVIKIKEPRNLVAIQVPNAPDLKIAAITLEK